LDWGGGFLSSLLLAQRIAFKLTRSTLPTALEFVLLNIGQRGNDEVAGKTTFWQSA
jgi:hypothetical protein